MKEVYLFVGVYLIIFSFYMIYFSFRNKNNKKTKMMEVMYLEKKYKLNLSYVNYSILCRNISLANSLIFVSTIFIIGCFENYFIKILMAFVSIFVLIIIVYGVLAIYYGRNTEE